MATETTHRQLTSLIIVIALGPFLRFAAVPMFLNLFPGAHHAIEDTATEEFVGPLEMRLKSVQCSSNGGSWSFEIDLVNPTAEAIALSQIDLDRFVESNLMLFDGAGAAFHFQSRRYETDVFIQYTTEYTSPSIEIGAGEVFSVDAQTSDELRRVWMPRSSVVFPVGSRFLLGGECSAFRRNSKQPDWFEDCTVQVAGQGILQW